tara:strand:+ start:4995 stop:7439 length:2445 start_codon:yes stop_codon:yes gene_type:complete
VLIAQETQTEVIEEVVVTAKPIKASQMSSIEAKRSAENLVDVVSADAIGRFPDQNIADSIGRLPGMSIERDQGRSRYLNFRGAPRRYTAIAFDGIDIPGTENGRIPRFDAYPAVITSQILANKAITPDMTGEAVAGFLNIKTFSPMDVEGFSASLDYGLGNQELGDGKVDRKNGRISFSNDKFGILVYATETLNEQITDNREMEYEEVAGGRIPVDLDYRNYFVDYGTEAFGGTLEYQLSETARVFLRSLRTEFTDAEQRNQFVFNIQTGASIVGAELTPNTGSTPLALVRRLWQFGDYSNSSDVDTLGLDLSMGEWFIDARASRIRNEFYTYLPIPYFIGTTTGVSYDVTNYEDPVLTLSNPLSSLTMDDYSTKLMYRVWQGFDTDNDQFKIDAERANSLGTMKFGLKYDVREADGVSSFQAGIGAFPLDDIHVFDTTKAWTTGMNNSVEGFYADNKGLRKALEAAGVAAGVNYDDDIKVLIQEEIVSAYGMQTIDTDFGSVVLGARLEETTFDTDGVQLVEGVNQPLTLSRSYSNFLPSAHVNWDLNEDSKLRFSFTTGISRPTYQEARASAGVDLTNRVVSGGNPNLKEESSWGIDGAYEWYFDEASIFAANVFYRQIDDVIVSGSTVVDGTIYSDEAIAGEEWNLVGFDNGSDGEMSGLELSFVGRLENYVEGFVSGFGIEANAAFLNSSFKSPDGIEFDLPGTSDLTYNAALSYENYGFSIRLSYRYRDSWLDTTENDTRDGVYWDAQDRLELSLRYDLEEMTGLKAIVYADFNNLNDATDIRYTGNAGNPNQVESYGSRYVMGVRVAF